MRTFKFTVRGDRITKDEDYIFVEGNRGSYEAVFDFGEEWEDMAKVCIVENGSDVYKVSVTGNGCLIPEVCGSSARIGVIGVDALDAELVTRISTNMVGIGIQDGAANKEVTASLDTAAAVWEKYLSDMEDSRKAAEAAADTAESAAADAQTAKAAAATSENNAKTAAANAESSAEEAKEAAYTASDAAIAAGTAFSEAENAREAAVTAAANLTAAVESAEVYAQNAENSANAAALSEKNAADTEERVEAIETEAENRLTFLKQDIQINLDEAQGSAERALRAAEEAEGYALSAKECESEAGSHAGSASIAMIEAESSEVAAKQALSDLLAMINSGDIVLATDGKLPLSSIPATATQEIYTVTSEDELTSLTAQRGDLAELIEEVDGEQTITKTWQCLGDASSRENWVVWGTSYAVQAGNATYANEAGNASMINNHRLVEMTEEEFAAAVKDEDTYYLVY